MNDFNMNYQFDINSSNVIIKRLLLIVTRPSYNDIYQRSYALHATRDTLNKLEAVFAQNGVAQNTPIKENILAQTIPEIVNLQANPLGIVKIPNGWSTQRIRFLLEVESNIGGITMVSYLQGFSEYYDPSITGLIDPNMLFYINSITNVVRQVDPVRGTYSVIPRSTYNVVTDLAGGSKYEEIDNGPDLKLIRPKDIVENISIMDMYSDNMTSVINTTGSIGGKANTSDRINNDPMKYFAKTINSFIEAKNLSDMSSDMTDVLRNASGMVTESSMMSLPFIYALHTITGQFTPTTFTLNVLKIIDPYLENKSHLVDNVNDILGNSYDTILDTNVTAEMLQPTPETLKASTIAQSLNSIMIECLLTSLDISFTNTLGQPVVVVSDAKSFIEGIDITAYVNRAVSRIKNILIPKITDGNMTLVEVYVHSDILGDTNVGIGLNMNPPITYRFPTFADSLYVPVLSDATNKASTIEDFSNILDLSYNVGHNY